MNAELLRELRELLAFCKLPWLPRYRHMPMSEVLEMVDYLRDKARSEYDRTSTGPFAHGCGGGTRVIRKGGEMS